MRITEYTVHRRLATGAIALALVVLGMYGVWRLPVDYLPEVTYPLVKVFIRWPGATAEEIDRDIADPVERLMATVDYLDELESTSREGIYSLDVNFEYGADVDAAFQDVLAALTRAEQNLPTDIDPPYVFKADPSQLPVIQLTVRSDRWGPVELREWADNWLQDRILAVRGVAGTEIIGGLEREIRILLDPLAMEKHKIPLQTVMRRLAEENVERTGGRVIVGRREIIARTVGEFDNLEQIRSVVIAQRGGDKLYLRDIAEVVDSHEDVRVVTRFNGYPCVKLSVLKEAEANTVQVAGAVQQKLEELASSLAEGLEMGMVENQAYYVAGALAGVRDAAIQAMVLLIIVVYLFLGSFRQVLVMVVALPLTMIVNFGLMKVGNFSLNVFSLGGLVVAIGVVLDNSIVVVENISRLRHEQPNESIKRQAIGGTAEVGPAIVAATLSFLALFMPFLLVPGMTSLLFRELILVIAGIVVVSLAIAVAMTPMLTTLFFGAVPQRRQATRFERFFDRFTEGYGWLLERSLQARWALIVAFLALLGLAGWLFGRVGGEFLPMVDDGRIMVKVKLPTGASVYETDRVLREIEHRIADDPWIESAFSLAGGRVMGLTTYEVANEGQIDIQLIPKSQRDISTSQYVSQLQPKVAQVPAPGGRIMARQMPIKGIHGLRSADLLVEIRGQDMETLSKLVQRTADMMDQSGQLRNVLVSMDMTKPEYQIKVDRTKATELGVSIEAISETIRSLISGAVISRYREAGEYYDIRILVPEERLTSRHQIDNFVVSDAGGKAIRVRDVANIHEGVGPLEIIRQNQVKQVTVEANVAGVDVATAVSNVRASLYDMELPAGYEFGFGGQAELMADMRNAVMAVVAFAVFFAFIVLTVQFNSVKLPALILGSAPFCLAGLVIGLYLSGLAFGATVVIAILVVIALNVNDGVLLMTFAEELHQQQELTAAESVIRAAKIRLRPRLMTTVTTIIGFVPLALNLGEGADMLQPMAVGAIGGLMMEGLVALFFMPCLYAVCTRSPRHVQPLRSIERTTRHAEPVEALAAR
ncbi:MAG: efflux RND transporter permease subunit [Pirellulales bacterium]|nr:efflux RND transporter permease subunit [Pirellulales bacterium]